MPAGFLVSHHRGPAFRWIEQSVGIEQRIGVAWLSRGMKRSANRPVLRVAAVRIEPKPTTGLPSTIASVTTATTTRSSG